MLFNIFYQCDLYENYFKSFSIEIDRMNKLENGLKMKNYKAYIFSLE